jgi:hypothetical protein
MLTKIERLKFIDLAKKGKIPKEIFASIIKHDDESQKKAEQISEWKKQSRAKTESLFAMEFEREGLFFVKKTWHNKNRVRQEVLFTYYSADRIYGSIDSNCIDFSLIVQNPDIFPDLIKYIEIRNDIKAMKKFIKQAKKE